MENSILTAGSFALDSITSPAGQVSKVLGGAANYFTMAASFFVGVAPISVVGDDFSLAHLQGLRRREVDISGIERISGGKSFFWEGRYDEDFKDVKTLVTELNVFEHFSPTLSKDHQKYPYIFLANMDPEIQLKVLDQLTDPKWVGLDTMNFWITQKLPALTALLKRVDFLCINEEEGFLLTGHRRLTTMIQALQAMGPRGVIIKRGAQGSMITLEKWTYLLPAYPVHQRVDPTGAGDTFAGAFFGYLATTHLDLQKPIDFWDVKHALLHGAVMASFTLEDFSFKRLESLTEAQFEKRLEKFGNWVDLHR